MTHPDEETVRRVLAKNGRDVRIRDAIEAAWGNVKAKYPDRSLWRRQSTTRHLVWEESVQGVIDVLAADSEVQVVSHYDTVSFIAEDKVLFRLKKAATSLVTANYPTLLAKMFHHHQADLFGHEGHHRVEIVHVFDRFQTALEWIGVVARDKKSVLWKFELPTGGAAVTALPTPLPLEPAAQAVLRPLTAPEQKKNDEEAP